ncbi:hypothetical protein ACTMU2_24295 [Cupriavidus basilensis]
MAIQNITGCRQPVRGTEAHWLTVQRLRLYASAALICYVAFLGTWMFRAWVPIVPGLFPPGGDFVVF